MRTIENLLNEPWALATTVVSVVIAFVVYLFREAIKEVVLGRLKANRERTKKLKELECLYSAVEREILSAMAKVGGRLHFSMRDVMENSDNAITISARGEKWIVGGARPKDAFALRDRGLLSERSNHSYELTDAGQAQGTEILKLLGLPGCMRESTSSKDV